MNAEKHLRLAGVSTQPDDVMIRPMVPIRKSTMRGFSAQPQNEGGQDEPQQEEHDQFYYP